VIKVRGTVVPHDAFQIEVTVFAGPKDQTLQNAGRLRLYLDEWTELEAALRNAGIECELR
jgi:hypothetical protein